MKTKRFISTLLALLLVCSLPVSAFAEEYDLSVGSVTVTAMDDGNGGTTQTVSQENGVQNHTETTPTVITQSNSSTPTTNTITINAAENATANVTLSGSDITITGSAKVTATGGDKASGIGGYISSFQNTNNGGSNITVSEDAQVKVQGGVRDYRSGSYDGAGAAIGNGGTWEQDGPNTGALTPNGKIEYYVPGEDINNATPYKTVTGTYVPAQDEEKPPVDEEKPDQPAEESAAEAVYAAPLYRVVNQDGKDILHSDARQDGVLTITVDADIASLTGKLGGIQTLKA